MNIYTAKKGIEKMKNNYKSVKIGKVYLDFLAKLSMNI